MQNYLDLVRDIYETGDTVKSRNSITREKFGAVLTFDNIGEHFPLVTSKFVPFRTVLAELVCFIRGYSDVRDFQKMGCRIWDANATSDYWQANPNYTPHWLGRIYGVQWRDFIGVNKDGATVHMDQLTELVHLLKTDPHNRRMGVTAWNPVEFEQMCLPPCHMWFQCNVTSQGVLNLCFYQRSCDMFLGVPFDIASYAALMLILCKMTGYTPGRLTHMMGSVHIYEAHYEVVEKMLSRKPYALPKVILDCPKANSFDDFNVQDFKFERLYKYHDKLSAPMIV